VAIPAGTGWCSMKRKREPKPPEPWADPWTGWWWHSRPVAKSLHVLEELGALVSETGRTDKDAHHALYPFSVSIRVTPLTPAPYPKLDQHGQPCGVYLPGDVFITCSRRELHAIAKEALRRKEAAAAEEEP